MRCGSTASCWTGVPGCDSGPYRSPGATSSHPSRRSRKLSRERKLTETIQTLFELAGAEKDYSSYPLLQWFIEEQVEEEMLVSQVVERLRMSGDDPSALLILDSELAQRQPTGA